MKIIFDYFRTPTRLTSQLTDDPEQDINSNTSFIFELLGDPKSPICRVGLLCVANLPTSVISEVIKYKKELFFIYFLF
jgi:hypothetical protein